MEDGKSAFLLTGTFSLCSHILMKEVSKVDIAVSNRSHLTATGNHIPYGITQCYLPPGRGDFPAFYQPKLVLDLATLEGYNAELTWVIVVRNNQVVSWLGIQPVSC